MMKRLTMLLCSLLLSTLATHAQPGNGIYLTRYTLTAGSDLVGEIRLLQGSIRSVALSGADAAAFSVDRSHRLLINGKPKAGATRFNLTITVTTVEGATVTGTFTLLVDQFIRNKVIAHRGAWKHTGATENSLAALRHAVTLGCEGSEFDVHLSADSLPMIHHDPAIQDISIARTPAATLQALKLTNGEPMPTLEEYLRTGLEQQQTRLILEIKSSELGKDHSLTLTRKAVALVERLQAQAWVDYISFDYDVCLEVMRLAPYARVAYLNGDKTPEELAAARFFGLDYRINVLQKNTDWIARAHQQRLTVNVWTVNGRGVMDDLLRQEVDFITTNEPELLLSIIKK